MATEIPLYVLPSNDILAHSRSGLLKTIPRAGIGFEQTVQHLQQVIVPALSHSSQSPNYYGFVTGGATPAAAYADNLVTEHDQNVCVHLPQDSIATDVDDAALCMLLDMMRLPVDQWPYRIFTTGATASNVLGLACGREYVVAQCARRNGQEASVASDGIFAAMRAAEIDEIQILSTQPHSSLRKAAAIVGLGRSCFKEVGQVDALLNFDMSSFEAALQRPRTASIVSISCAEINTGSFATSEQDVRVIRTLCDRYGAWLHVDAAFGLQARCLDPDDVTYRAVSDGVAGLELVDSITGDAHKLLNVPYDCGIFFSRHLPVGKHVFQNPGAAYLRTDSASIVSPLNIGLENSRRFRALPVYATLASHGRDGYRDMLSRQIDLARAISRIILQLPAYDLLPAVSEDASPEDRLQAVYIVVLFRAKNGVVNDDLVRRINATRRIYVSGTQWEGRPAARFAVSNWKVDVKRDSALVEEVLTSVIE